MTSLAKTLICQYDFFLLWIKIETRNQSQTQCKNCRESPHLPWSARAEHTGALAFDHGNFNQSFSHFIGNSSPPYPFKHCLGELSAAGSTSGNYTCKVTLGAVLNISAKCMGCWEALEGTAASQCHVYGGHDWRMASESHIQKVVTC